MKRWYLLCFMAMLSGFVVAQDVVRVDFSKEKGKGWNEGEVVLPGKAWDLNYSGLKGGRGRAQVGEDGFFVVEGCVGDVVFRLDGVRLLGQQAKVSLLVGGEKPEESMAFDVMNVDGNRMVFRRALSAGAAMCVVVGVRGDSLWLEVRGEGLEGGECFSFDDIEVSLPGGVGAMSVVCMADADTLRFLSSVGELEIPFLVRNGSAEGMVINGVEFEVDSSFLKVVGHCDLSVAGGVFSPTVLNVEKVRFYSGKGLLTIAPYDSLIFSLRLSMNAGLVPDGCVLGIVLPSEQIEYLAGSARVDWVGDIPSVLTVVERTGVRMLGYDYLKEGGVGVWVGACDGHYNPDTDVEGDCLVSVFDDKQVMIAEGMGRFAKGIFLQRFELPRGSYGVKLDGGDAGVVCGFAEKPIYCEGNGAVNGEWVGGGDWVVDDGWLRHGLEKVSGTSCYMGHYGGSGLKDKDLSWRFTIRNGGWKPSSSNYFRYYLLADTTVAGAKHAVYVTTDEKTGEVALVMMSGNKRSVLWHGGRVWRENEQYSVQVEYRIPGYWEVRLAEGEGVPFTVGHAEREIPASFWEDDVYSGLLFCFGSASRAGSLWVRDLELVAGESVLPPEPPVVEPGEWVAGDVLVSEVMYDAVPVDAEYIELYNNSGRRIDVRDLRVAKRNTAGELFAVKSLTTSPLWLEPGELIWVCSMPDVIADAYTCHREDNCFVLSTKLALNNDGGSVVVLESGGCVLDELEYGPWLHTSGFSVAANKGRSLERVDYGMKTDDEGAWGSAGGSVVDGYGSPGMPNRVGDKAATVSVEGMLECSPEVITPDGDGVDDELEIYVTDEGHAFTLTLFVYDTAGKMVRIITEGAAADGQKQYLWDARNQNGAVVSAGIYVVRCEVVWPEGRKRVLRRTCVVSR